MITNLAHMMSVQYRTTRISMCFDTLGLPRGFPHKSSYLRGMVCFDHGMSDKLKDSDAAGWM